MYCSKVEAERIDSLFGFQTLCCLAVEHTAYQLCFIRHTRTTVWKRMDIEAVDTTLWYGHIRSHIPVPILTSRPHATTVLRRRVLFCSYCTYRDDYSVLCLVLCSNLRWLDVVLDHNRAQVCKSTLPIGVLLECPSNGRYSCVDY